jgi:hypothetical protein
MPIHVSTAEKKAEIARDVVVAYLSHVKDEELTDLGKVDEAITRLVDVVDRTFEVEEHRAAEPRVTGRIVLTALRYPRLA